MMIHRNQRDASFAATNQQRRLDRRSGIDLLEREPESFSQILANIDPKDRWAALCKGNTFKVFLPQGKLRSFAVNLVTVENPLQMSLVEIGAKAHANARFNGGEVLRDVDLSHINIYKAARFANLYSYPIAIRNSDRRGIRADFEFAGRRLSFGLADDSIYTIGEVFFKKIYNRLSCEGKIVLDLGANVGDSAIYFALRGASMVIALEPYPYAYCIAKDNLIVNGMDGKVGLLNAGIAGQSQEVAVNPNFRNTSSSRLKDFGAGTKVRLFSLGELVREFPLQDAVLKMDVESWEYDALLKKDRETLRTFLEIIVEYHKGYRNIWTKLEGAGFSVEHVERPHYARNHENGFMAVGTLYAKRND